jgi:aminoglycoside 3-N-acetyltransferase
MQEIVNYTKHRPLIIHINPIGLLRVGSNNAERFLNLHTALNKIQKEGGNIAVPSYSYTYTKNENYKIINTPSELGEIDEYLRYNNKYKRTIDANFSYLLFGNNFSKKHLKISNYSTFGGGSLIEEVFNKNGYLGVIGGVWEHLTELHFIEKKLGVDYRFDKTFNGISIDINGKEFKNTITYFCRYLDSSNLPYFTRFKKDIRSSDLIRTLKITEYNLTIEVVKIQDLFLFIKEKIALNPRYLLK